MDSGENQDDEAKEIGKAEQTEMDDVVQDVERNGSKAQGSVADDEGIQQFASDLEKG
jgi:hypothetical protein